MRFIAFLLNLPWTCIGLALCILSVPSNITLRKDSFSIVVYVRSFWWLKWKPGNRYVRAITNGHIVQLGPLHQANDLQHELIHVDQFIREPLIHPLLYSIESVRHGYKDNKYEVEAYRKAGNSYYDMR